MVDIDCPDSVLVIAWGNPLREDDAVAWHVLEGLRSLKPRRTLPLMKLRHAHQLAPEMAECVSKAQGVVFIDARRDGQPGEIRCEVIAPSAGSNPLAHSLSPQALLLFAEQLYGRAPRAVVLSIAGERFGMGEALSPVVRRAIPRAIRTVVRQAKGWSAATPQAVQPG
jgi:hydrogenase maturation protease